MSFVPGSFAEHPLRTPEQVAREVHEVSLSRGLDEFASVLALMCIAQESNFWCPWNRKDPISENYDHDSESDDGRSVGYLQQQNKVPGENPTGPGENWWGPMASRMDLKRAVNEFLDRLADNYHDAAGNPTLAAQFIQNVQGSAYRDGGPYIKHWDRAWQLVNGLGVVEPAPPPPPAPPGPLPAITPNPGWRGDPVFLLDLCRAWGLDVREMDGARDRGHGDFGAIWGIVAHHTGSFGETPEGIAFHPSLGLASQLYLGRNGEVVICGTGVAWHAGAGSWPGIPEDGANQVCIGIEAANDGGGTPGKPHRSSWSNAQYESYTTLCAAILWFLGHRADRLIGHKEWAGAKQGKWDPGAIDMDIMRADVQRKIDAGPPGGGATVVIGDVILSGNDAAIVVAAARKVLAMWDNDDLGRRHGWTSRARCRESNQPVDDTIGMELFIDANIYDLLTAWSAVELGDPYSVGVIMRGAAGKLPAAQPADLAWFASVEAKITKTAKARAATELERKALAAKVEEE